MRANSKDMATEQVIGLIRFSILPKSPGAFAISKNKSSRIYKEALFDPQRLNKRFAIFETVTLPSLDGQVDKDFYIIICASTYLPEPYKERLEYLSSTRRYLTIRYFDDSLFMQRIASICVGDIQKSNRVINFRLDDDDAISFDFIENLKNVSSLCGAGQVITFQRGVYIRGGAAGRLDVAELNYPKIAIGLSHIRSSQDNSTIFDCGNHVKIDDDKVFNVKTPIFWWIRSVYGESDSRHLRDVFEKHKKISTHMSISCDEAASMLQERFPLIDFNQMQRVL